MTEIEVAGHNYRLGKLDARTQFHIARRLAPLIAGMTEGATTITAAMMPIAAALSEMSDKDVDYVLDACLAVCQRQQGTSFAPVMTRTGVQVFDDINMMAMMKLTVEVIKDSLGNFFPGALASGAA